MARLAITAVAGGVGTIFFGQTGLGLAAGGILGNLILGPEGQDQKQEGPRLQDLKVQTSAYGTPILTLYGTLRVPSSITWSSGIEETVHEDTEGGGKGGGSEVTTKTYTYSASFECTFCAGELADVRRVWFDSVLVADFSDTASSATRANSETFKLAHFVFYPGSESDAVDPTISAYEGAANTPAGRGKARIVFTDIELEDYGNRIPNVTAELARDLTVLIDWTHAFPGTPITPPNTDWALQDVATRHYLGTEPASSNGLLQIARRAQESLGEFDNDSEYNWRVDIRRAGGNRHGYLEVVNSDNDVAVYKFSLTDGTNLDLNDAGSIVTSNTVTDLGDGWFRASLTFDSGSGTFPGNFMWLKAGAIANAFPYSKTYNYAGSTFQTEVKSPSFRTTLGVAFGVQALPDVITDICSQSGLSTSLIEVDDLPGLGEDHGEVRGYATGQQSGRGAIENLEKAHFFDGVESEGLIKFIPRGGAIRATIDTEEMVVSGEGGSALRITRGDDKSLPKRVSVTYLQRDKLYQPGEAHAQRIGSASEAEANTDVRMVLTDEEAAQAADVLLYAAYAERVQFEFSLPIEYFYLDPADLITVTDGAQSYTVRLTSISLENLLVMRCQGVEENPELYVSNWTGAGGTADDRIVGDASTTTLALLDAPLLLESQDGPWLQFALGGESPSWFGARAFRSNDAGVTYESIASASISAKIGAATDALGAGNTETWDTVSTVNVELNDDTQTLESRTDLAVLNGANAAALVHVDDTIEIIQYATATLEGDGTWTLSRLLRGRRGTEHAASGHAIGDQFVYLARGYLNAWATTQADINLQRKFKGVSVGTDIADVSAQNYTYTGVNLKPFSPVHLAGSRDGSNNLTITWVRRSRFIAQMLWTPALGEASEAYEIDVMDGATVKRTISATSETASYSAAQQTTDGFTPGDPIEVNIYQMSDVVGRGYAGNSTI